MNKAIVVSAIIICAVFCMFMFMSGTQKIDNKEVYGEDVVTELVERNETVVGEALEIDGV